MLELQWFHQQQDLWFIPLPIDATLHCWPPTKKGLKSTPSSLMCHPPPHEMCHHSPVQCMAMTAAKYLVFGAKSSFVIVVVVAIGLDPAHPSNSAQLCCETITPTTGLLMHVCMWSKAFLIKQDLWCAAFYMAFVSCVFWSFM